MNKNIILDCVGCLKREGEQCLPLEEGGAVFLACYRGEVPSSDERTQSRLGCESQSGQAAFLDPILLSATWRITVVCEDRRKQRLLLYSRINLPQNTHRQLFDRCERRLGTACCIASTTVIVTLSIVNHEGTANRSTLQYPVVLYGLPGCRTCRWERVGV